MHGSLGRFRAATRCQRGEREDNEGHADDHRVSVFPAVTTGCGIALLLTVGVLAGCDDGSDQPARSYAWADAKRAARIQPTTPGWSWPRSPTSSEIDSPDDEPPATSDDPLAARLFDRIADVENLGGASSQWEDDDKLANLDVGALGSVAGAQTVMEAYRDFAHDWGESFGDVTKDEDVRGLGDDAWVIWVAGNGAQVTYQWRRGNLVLLAHMHCFGTCPEDVDGAARAWADAIDDKARGEG